jgi:hypothetical protein
MKAFSIIEKSRFEKGGWKHPASLYTLQKKYFREFFITNV